MACRAFPLPFHPDSRSSAHRNKSHSLPSLPNLPAYSNSASFQSSVRFSPLAAIRFRAGASAAMDELKSADASSVDAPMKLLFVEMGVGYDQHGQDITVAAMRACKDAISSNSIPAFRSGALPGVNTDQMKLRIKLGVPRSTQPFLDVARVKSIFPYGKIVNFEVVDGGLICSSGVCLEAMGDKNDDCYIVNAAVYVGY